MCEEHLGQCFVLGALHRLPTQSVLTWLEISVIVFCFFFFAQYHKCIKYFGSVRGW